MANQYLTEHQQAVLGNIKMMLSGVEKTQKFHTQKFDVHSDILEDLRERMKSQEELTTRVIDILLSINSVLTQTVNDIAEIKSAVAKLKP